MMVVSRIVSSEVPPRYCRWNPSFSYPEGIKLIIPCGIQMRMPDKRKVINGILCDTFSYRHPSEYRDVAYCSHHQSHNPYKARRTENQHSCCQSVANNFLIFWTMYASLKIPARESDTPWPSDEWFSAAEMNICSKRLLRMSRQKISNC